MDKERNEFLEMNGLYWESETHEWFHDKIGTNYAQSDNGLHEDDLKSIFCFIVRNKETGEYDRVVMDSETNEIIYNSKSVEDIGGFIDKLKISKRFKEK
jgi:hypothetical protein